MKEAFGGIFNMVFIIIFLVIVIGVLGLVFSYTKAFKMKNAIISIIEEYEGSGCTPEMTPGSSIDTACRNKVKLAAEGLAYNPTSLNCSEPGFYNAEGYFCYKKDVYPKNISGVNYHFATYRIITQVDINFPIIQRIMGLSFFQVGGDTKEIRLPS